VEDATALWKVIDKPFPLWQVQPQPKRFIFNFDFNIHNG
jgi:hypothetical protein